MLTVSDRGVSGERDDRSGALLVRRLAELPADIVWRHTVADEALVIAEAVRDACTGSDLLVSTGGTGLAARDVTPQAVAPLLDFQVPGLAEAMRAHGLRSTPFAALSRQLCGVRGRTLVLLLPGSERAVGESLEAVWEVLPHALRLLGGDTRH